MKNGSSKVKQFGNRSRKLLLVCACLVLNLLFPFANSAQAQTHTRGIDVSKFQDNYIRIQLRDAEGRMAWTNPVFV